MIVDLQDRRVVDELVQNFPQWFDAYTFAVDGRFFLTMGAGDDKSAELGEARLTRLFASFDGATGTIGGPPSCSAPAT